MKSNFIKSVSKDFLDEPVRSITIAIQTVVDSIASTKKCECLRRSFKQRVHCPMSMTSKHINDGALNEFVKTSRARFILNGRE